MVVVRAASWILQLSGKCTYKQFYTPLKLDGYEVRLAAIRPAAREVQQCARSWSVVGELRPLCIHDAWTSRNVISKGRCNQGCQKLELTAKRSVDRRLSAARPHCLALHSLHSRKQDGQSHAGHSPPLP